MALVKIFSIEEEMKKNPELDKSDLNMLKDWLKKQPHLPPLSEAELILFLHSNYYRIEPTKTTIDTYFTIRTHVPEFFTMRDPLGSKEIQECMKVVSTVMLPSTTPEGYNVVFAKLLNSDPSRWWPVDNAKVYCMLMDLWLCTRGTSPGHIFVIDMEGAAFGHMLRLNPMIVKKFIYYFQEALPIRLKGIHVINTMPVADLILNMARPFMKKELLDMLVFHYNLKTFTKTVPIDVLPNEHGGKAGNLKDLWAAEVKDIEKHGAWFQAEESRKVNEAARPEKSKNIADSFGIDGSFKKLDID